MKTSESPRLEQLEKMPYKGKVPVVVEALLDKLAYQVVVQGKNIIMAFLGDVGTGKSWGAVNFARLFDPWFSMDKVVYEPDEFFDALDSVKHRGEVIVWDEAGVGMPAREWNSLFNRVVSKTLQIFREATPGRIILIFATPRKVFMDKTARIMLNHEWRFEWKVGEPHPYAKPYELYRVVHYRTKTMEDYTVYRFPRVVWRNLEFRITKLYMAPLPKDIAEAYRIKSQPRKTELRFTYMVIQALGENFPTDVSRWLYDIINYYGPENFLTFLDNPLVGSDQFGNFTKVLAAAVRQRGEPDDVTFFEEFKKYFSGSDADRMKNRFIRYMRRWLERHAYGGGKRG